MNREIVLSNLKEAKQELKKLISRLSSEDDDLDLEAEIEIGLGHAYHHLNVAWNARHVSTEIYAHLTNEQFNQWSQFPTEIEPYQV